MLTAELVVRIDEACRRRGLAWMVGRSRLVAVDRFDCRVFPRDQSALRPCPECGASRGRGQSGRLALRLFDGATLDEAIGRAIEWTETSPEADS